MPAFVADRAVWRWVAAALVSTVGVASAEEPAREPAAAIVEAVDDDVPAKADAAEPAREPSADEADAPVEPRIVHPPVNFAAFDRRYRSFPSDEPAAAAGRAALDGALAGLTDDTWIFVETSLVDVVRHLRTSLGVPVAIDHAALEDEGLDSNTPVTFRGQGERVGAALNRMLEPVGMAITIADGAILVTSRVEACGRPVSRIYPVPFGLGGFEGAEDLLDLVQSTVEAQSWDVVGGVAAIRPVGPPGSPFVVVTQTLAGHDKVEALLAAIHARGLAEFTAAERGPSAPVVRVHRVVDEHARSDLAATLVELCNGSLPEGRDPAARVTVVGESLAVQSVSPEFHALAGQLIAAVCGIRVGPPPPSF